MGSPRWPDFPTAGGDADPRVAQHGMRRGARARPVLLGVATLVCVAAAAAASARYGAAGVLALCARGGPLRLRSSPAWRTLLVGRAAGAKRGCAGELEGHGTELQRRPILLSAGLLGIGRADPADALSAAEKAVSALFNRTTPSVVSITRKPVTTASGEKPPQIYGSGFVWDQEHIVTNYHVVTNKYKDKEEKPFVTFLYKPLGSKEEKRASVEAIVIGADPASDIAVLYINGPMPNGTSQRDIMRPLSRGTSANLLVGQDVFALGNPFGLEHSISRGIISGVSRTMEGVGGRPINGVIQTDASINPGNSGGPLLDSSGQVIGVNTAILSGSGGFSGVGLAIPMDAVERNVRNIIEKGFVRRPFLGIVFAPDMMSEELSLTGLLVMKVVAGGPAEAAGVRPMRAGRLGDIVVGLDGKRVGTSEELFRNLDDKVPGKNITVSLLRASADPEIDTFERKNITVKLGVMNSNKNN